ncbi:hypothetical protein H4F69_14980 [Pectobacterium brasiliense]|uniref:hypothetical protein n=1 Tax=Pectobacterium brasiliense TaxID=180957 RepID=UPI001969654C|nr:hypothetical protein [Pectobacterium brasiliense]MBN3174850.1 hypothetical protein [Pectobacterium brasiliense]MBN3200777.1 hypothetical protein [Pectobacterium brasiliense]MBN3206032.1 hypothetical protein [Pectobacterium brasiliense]
MNNSQQQTAARKRRQPTAGNSNNVITKEQWALIAEELKSYFCYVQFQYQDTVITIARERDGESKTVLSVYIDGKMSWVWGRKESEFYNPITELFWCEKKKRFYSAQRAAKIEKEFGKRRAKEFFPKLYDSISFRLPYFATSTSLIRQFKKADGLVWLCKSEEDSDQS